MERANYDDRNGGFKLPIGFRFHPTDEELVVHYLKRKVFSLPLPAAVIPELQAFHSSPWDLPGDLKEKRYFFSKRKMNFTNKSSNYNLTTECGYWKANCKDKQILAPSNNLVIGIKRSYVFYQVTKGRRVGLKTQWIMHEFGLVGSITTPFLTQVMMQVGDWVVCRVYRRRRKTRDEGTVDQDYCIARNLTLSCSSPSSSCSSGITDISCDDLDQEAISPHCY